MMIVSTILLFITRKRERNRLRMCQ